VSWRILLDEVERTYKMLGVANAKLADAEIANAGTTNNGTPANRSAALSARSALSTSYAEWAHRLVQEANSQTTLDELPYWLTQERAAAASVPLPRDHQSGENRVSSAQTITVEFSEAQTESLLREVPRRLRAQLEEVLLLALLEAVCRWSGSSSLVVMCESHGREPLSGVDVDSTVGWFTSLYPLWLERVEGSVSERLSAVRERVRGVPRRGLGYGLLKYLRREEALRGGWKSEGQVSFNYLGQWDANLMGIFVGAEESEGRAQWEGEEREAEVEVHGSVHGGRLRMQWTYSREQYEGEKMERVVEWFREAVEEVIAACCEESAALSPAELSASEISDISLSDAEWNALLATVRS
jgi:non-ribosomal peptide synthase protein (TIGR01720 family)